MKIERKKFSGGKDLTDDAFSAKAKRFNKMFTSILTLLFKPLLTILGI